MMRAQSRSVMWQKAKNRKQWRVWGKWALTVSQILAHTQHNFLPLPLLDQSFVAIRLHRCTRGSSTLSKFHSEVCLTQLLRCSVIEAAKAWDTQLQHTLQTVCRRCPDQLCIIRSAERQQPLAHDPHMTRTNLSSGSTSLCAAVPTLQFRQSRILLSGGKPLRCCAFG